MEKKTETKRTFTGGCHCGAVRSDVTHHPFCRTCGVRCFGRGDLPELGGAYVAVNLHSLDDAAPAGVPVVHWDGRYDAWERGPIATGVHVDRFAGAGR